jgi:glucose-6-phosphate isomerase
VSIHFDEKNLLAARVGEANGLSSGEVNDATPAALDALSSFRKSSDEGRYGFPQLPLQKATVRSIYDYAKGLRGSHDTVCVVGIGGSALGAWALDCALHGPHPIQSKTTRGWSCSTTWILSSRAQRSIP